MGDRESAVAHAAIDFLGRWPLIGMAAGPVLRAAVPLSRLFRLRRQAHFL
jgi:hypothetical protein